MEVHIENRSSVELPIGHIRDLALFVLRAEGLSESTELSVSFVGLDEITSLNAAYRGKEEPTDVLSFELDDPWVEGMFDDGEQLLLGDIVINPDLAQKHAHIEEVTLEEELWILVIHGILHLVGYDHLETEETQLMEDREDRYFSSWEIELGVW